MEPREKPVMQKPKTREQSGQVVKDARSMLVQGYKRQALDKADCIQGGAEYADEKLEGAAAIGGRTAKRTAGRGVRDVRDKVKSRRAGAAQDATDGTGDETAQAAGGNAGEKRAGKEKTGARGASAGAGESDHGPPPSGETRARTHAQKKAAERTRAQRRGQTASQGTN